MFFDAIRVKIMDQGFVRNKAVYIALGILPDGTKELLGIWIEQTEGAKFWMRVMNELRNRGIADILIAVVDGLKGFPDAINAVFPETVVQTCIVHLTEGSRSFASWKDRKAVTSALRSVYRAENAEGGPGRIGRLRGELLGPEIPSHLAELAPTLGAGDPVLCVQRHDQANDLHHQRDRGAELEAAPRCSHPRTLPR
ncbi:Transposase, Mutator family [Erythrobacter litoralis]|nr:Transposase, Mutator family [Erythrobacter litoralis]